MSKSLGNVVLPTEICEKWGADLLRLWVASQDYTADVRMSENVMTQLSEAYRKIRNTFRFALGNLADFDPARDAVPEQEMEELDRWMLQRTSAAGRCMRGFYETSIFTASITRCTTSASWNLSAFYFDVLKDRLYTFAPQQLPRGVPRRRPSIASPARWCACWRRFSCFTADEIWKYLPRQAGEPDSVHLALFPQSGGMPRVSRTRRSTRAGSNSFEVRAAVLQALEQARNAKTINGGARGARRTVRGRHAGASCCGDYAAWLPALFIVSQVELADRSLPPDAIRSEALPGLAVTVRRASGQKMRALLELFDARRRKRRLSHGLRALRGRARRDRARAARRASARLLMAEPRARPLALAHARGAGRRPRHQICHRAHSRRRVFAANWSRTSPPWSTA